MKLVSRLVLISAIGLVALVARSSAQAVEVSTVDRRAAAAFLDSGGRLAVSPGIETAVPLTIDEMLAAFAARSAAERDTNFRIVVSINQKQLWALRGTDTLLSAPVGVGMDAQLDFQGRRWIFKTPRGERVVRKKMTNPVWIPPDWHYAEVAQEAQLRVAVLPSNRPIKLRDGSLLEVRDSVVGLVQPGAGFAALPTDEEIVFDSTLFIPPLGTINRRIEGELGAYQLDLGDGYLLHGTPYQESIGRATTHGCIRLTDADIAWLFARVPVGTRVYLY